MSPKKRKTKIPFNFRLTLHSQLLCRYTFCLWILLNAASTQAHAEEVEEFLGADKASGTAKTYISTFTSLNIPVKYSIQDGLAVLEGDILIGSHVRAQKQRRLVDDSLSLQKERGPQGSVPFAIYIAGQYYRWPNGTLIYEISDSLLDQHRIVTAMKLWETSTQIRFKKRDSEMNYVKFIRPEKGRGCLSPVGMIGGEQPIYVGDNCTAGNITHEIGHALGLWHEHSRSDRDSNIRIEWDNVIPEERSNFDQRISDGIDSGDYDFGSIMHYPHNAFALQEDRSTIVSPKPIGQRERLSQGDRDAISNMYFR